MPLAEVARDTIGRMLAFRDLEELLRQRRVGRTLEERDPLPVLVEPPQQVGAREAGRERVVTVAAISGPPTRLHVCRIPGFRTDGAEKGRRMKGSGSHFQVQGL